MNRETIEKIFNFLKEKEGKKIPKKWDLIKKLETHPDGTEFKHYDNLDLSNSAIGKLPDDLYVSGNFSLSKCKQLTKLPNKLYVGFNLVLTQSNITELTNLLYVGGNLSIKDTPLANKYTDEQIYEMVESTGGLIVDRIYR